MALWIGALIVFGWLFYQFAESKFERPYGLAGELSSVVISLVGIISVAAIGIIGFRTRDGRAIVWTTVISIIVMLLGAGFFWGQGWYEAIQKERLRQWEEKLRKKK